jgi:acyl-CoA synthetase (AMP-forming)/AMP-acid ligase II
VTVVGRVGDIVNTDRDEIRAESLRWAAYFADKIDEGDRVALCLPTSVDFLHAFFGVLYAGGVAVPLPSMIPHQEEYVPPFLQARAPVLNDCSAKFLVTHDQFAETLGKLTDWCQDLQAIITPEEVGDTSADGFEPVELGHDDLAMLQYTSGSTGLPKGVELTHHCLLWNLDAIASGVGTQPDDACVSWLPLYHDMGLIGGCLWPLGTGIGTSLMATEVFLTDPSFWLQAMSTKSATITVAPNFGYALSVKRVKEDALEALDLSNLRVMLCGAEPIDPSVLAAFQDKFAPAGLPEDVIMPVYGLAEATLAVTFTEPGAPVKVLDLDRQRLEEDGVAEDATEDSNVLHVVCVGAPLLDAKLRIVDEDGNDLPENRQGEILIDSPSLMRGYYQNAQATERTLENGWLHTGDLGFLRDGELYITGRLKDLIITYGRNFYPHDIERIAQQVDGIRTGCVVAFGLHNDEESTDEIAIVAETRETDRKELIRMRREMRKLLINAIECNPKYVRIVPPREVPKTTSGKLRRNEARRMFVEKEFTKLL